MGRQLQLPDMALQSTGNAQGGLYQWDSATQSFNYLADGFTNVAVANDNVVFAYNTGTGATYWYF